MVKVDVKRVATDDGGNATPTQRVQQDGCGYLVLKWLVAAATIWVVAWILDPHVAIDGFGRAMIVAVVIGLLNVFVRPVMILLTLPITVVTLGLFLLVINAALLMFTQWLIAGFTITNFWWALLASLLISVINALVGGLRGRTSGKTAH